MHVDGRSLSVLILKDCRMQWKAFLVLVMFEILTLLSFVAQFPEPMRASAGAFLQGLTSIGTFVMAYRLLATEESSGTIRFLKSLPLTNDEIFWSKFLFMSGYAVLNAAVVNLVYAGLRPLISWSWQLPTMPGVLGGVVVQLVFAVILLSIAILANSEKAIWVPFPLVILLLNGYTLMTSPNGWDPRCSRPGFDPAELGPVVDRGRWCASRGGPRGGARGRGQAESGEMTSVSTQDPVSEDLKRYRRGTHRACDPSETYDHLRALMPRCGITRIANITGLDRVGVPVYTAIRPNSRALSTSQGKGMDRDAARASALMEAFESWHGERVSADGGYYRREEAEDENGIPVADVGRISRRGRDVSWLSSTRINWVRGLDVMSGVAVLLPYDCVSSDFTGDVQRVAFIRSTNGLASGNTLTEATLHGLYEVIERDAVALWSPSAGTADRVVDPGTVHDEDNAALLDRLADAGLGVLIRDVRCDTRVPVFAVAIAPTNPTRMPPFAAFSGYGAHLDPRVALSRALTEAIQSRLTVIHGGRDDLWPSAYARVLDPPGRSELGSVRIHGRADGGLRADPRPLHGDLLRRSRSPQGVDCLGGRRGNRR
jgi:ribosomal protein S12 methylthiotransferase accessory factor